jgi:hypothetical protein
LDGSIAQSFRGVLSYNDEANRFEASTSDGAVAGRKSGGGIVFAMADTNIRGTVQSTMTLKGNLISIAIRFVDKRNNQASEGTVSFARS